MKHPTGRPYARVRLTDSLRPRQVTFWQFAQAMAALDAPGYARMIQRLSQGQSHTNAVIKMGDEEVRFEGLTVWRNG